MVTLVNVIAFCVLLQQEMMEVVVVITGTMKHMQMVFNISNQIPRVASRVDRISVSWPDVVKGNNQALLSS